MNINGFESNCLQRVLGALLSTGVSLRSIAVGLAVWSLILLPTTKVLAEQAQIRKPFTVVESSRQPDQLKAAISDDILTQAASATERLVLELPLPTNKKVVLNLERFDIVAPDALFLVGSAGGDKPLERSDVALFRGTVDGQPGSLAYASISPIGLINGFVDGGVDHIYAFGTLPEDIKSGKRQLTVRATSAFGESEIPLCGTKDDPGAMFDPEALKKMATIEDAGPFLLKVAIDADQRFVQIFSSTMEARDYIVQLIGALTAIFERDNNIRLVLAFARLWPQGNEPFTPHDVGAFRNYWETRDDPADYNIIHLFSGRRDTPYRGIAYLGNTCTSYKYGVDAHLNGSFTSPVIYPDNGTWDVFLVAHEMGHNCGAQHTHSGSFEPVIDDCGNGTFSRGTIMSYCSKTQGYNRNVDMRFHRRVQQVIAGWVWPAGCHGRDCNGNNVDDATDIAEAVSLDVNSDGIPDECQDCNLNETLDPEDIANGAPDVDGNGIPDDCQSDCDNNSTPDRYDTWILAAPDDDGNNIPDECDPDCNTNGILDYTEINLDMSLDLDRNRVLDYCQDCNENTIPDWIDLGRPHNLYVCGSDYGEVREFQATSGVLERTFTIPSGPVDVVSSGDGVYLYVANSGLGITRITVSDGSTTLFIDSGDGGLGYAYALVLGPGNVLYVADWLSSAVRKYDAATGAPLGDFVYTGASPMNSPRALTFGPNGNLYVASDDDAVFEYNGTSGVYVRTFITTGSGSLSAPRGLAFRSDGNLLVTSNGGPNPILEYDGTTGAFVRVFNDDFTLDDPWGIKIGPNGNVFVTGYHLGQARVLEYFADAPQYYRSFVRGIDILADPRGLCFLPASPDDVNGNFIPDSCEAGDLDSDGIADIEDNCLSEYNPSQTDSDGDGAGDACDNCPSTVNTDQRDVDFDGYGDLCDNCPAVANFSQSDSDLDGRGDGCDNCQGLLNPDQLDFDGDLVGDLCDPCPEGTRHDYDDDGLCEANDNCPDAYNPGQEDQDSNGIGDICEVGYTPPGSEVLVTPFDGITISFDSVTLVGFTSVTTTDVGPELPGILGAVPLSSPLFYDIQTTALFEDTILICISYDDTSIVGAESELGLYHFGGDPAEWQNIMTSHDTVSNEICGKITSLSLFAIAEPVGCCTGTMGNVDCEGIIDIGDVTTMISNLFITLNDPCCEAEADIDVSGLVDIGDLTALISSLFITLNPLEACP